MLLTYERDYPEKRNECAFEHCDSLASVSMQEGVTEIGDHAFSGCSSLMSVRIPNSVTEIGGRAFEETPWLNSLTEEFVIVGEGVLLDYNGSSASVAIPEGVKMISSAFDVSVFEAYDSLMSVTIPEGVKTIGDYAFIGCSSLANVVIPDSVTEIGNSAFWYCTSLVSITIPENVTVIDRWAFEKTPWFESLTEEFVVVGQGVLLDYNGNDAYVSIPEGVRMISSAFSNCDSLTSVNIPKGVTEIGEGAFSGCDSLISVNIPKSVTKIGGYAFFGCTALTNIDIPQSVVEIGDAAFWECTSLTNVSILEGLRQIDRNAFWECSSLKNINIPESVRNIGDGAFSDCSSLTSVSILGHTTRVGEYAFGNCPNVTLYITEGSCAYTWAVENGVNYQLIHTAGSVLPTPAPSPIATESGMMSGKYICENAITMLEGTVHDPAEVGSYIIFYEDGTFLFRENYYEGWCDMPGTYWINELGSISCRIAKEDLGAWNWTGDFAFIPQPNGELIFSGRNMSMTVYGGLFIPVETEAGDLSDKTGTSFSESQLGNTPANISLGGYGAQCDGWVYLSSYNSDSGLRKMRPDGGENMELVPYNCSFINVREEWVYFSNRDDSGRLYRIRTDGSRLEQLTSERAIYTAVLGEWIYFIAVEQDQGGFPAENFGSIYKSRLDGSERICLLEGDYTCLSIADGKWMFFCDASNGYSIGRARLDGSDTQIISDEPALCIQAAEGCVYWAARETEGELVEIFGTHYSETVFCMDIDGNNKKQLVQPDVIFWNAAIQNGEAFTDRASSEAEPLYVSTSDREPLQMLHTDACGIGFSLIGDWVYYYATEPNVCAANPTGAPSSETAGFYRIRYNGNDRQLIWGDMR